MRRWSILSSSDCNNFSFSPSSEGSPAIALPLTLGIVYLYVCGQGVGAMVHGVFVLVKVWGMAGNSNNITSNLRYTTSSQLG